MSIARVLATSVSTVLAVGVSGLATWLSAQGTMAIIESGAGEGAAGTAGLIPFTAGLFLLPLIAEIGLILSFLGIRSIFSHYVLGEDSSEHIFIDTAISFLVVNAAVLLFFLLY